MEPVPSTSFDTSRRHNQDDPLENILSTIISPSHNMASPDYVMQTQEKLDDQDLYGILSGNNDHLLNEEINEDEDEYPQENFDDDVVEPVNDWCIGNPHSQNFLDFQQRTGLKVDMRNKEPVDFYLLILDRIMNLILTCSNRYE
ncbi:unnamed protein product [Euphydryas editha]|uniref:Uncharacterized protein n=1 Tax=Euphydryas editha TaxID=104508 RepID=A0AAU9TQL5_EUPED|nr:unnamed protein product [Euphydryas editha]